MIIYRNIPQGSLLWFLIRAGNLTASRFQNILKKGRGDAPSATRVTECINLATERLTGKPLPPVEGVKALEWGKRQEPAAKRAYSLQTGRLVQEVGFIRHNKLKAGASPDGLIGRDGGLELKCPYNSTIHTRTLKFGLPKEHLPQIQGCLWITKRDWWDFGSFDPRMPLDLQLYIQRVERDDEYIEKLEGAVRTFLGEVEALFSQLTNKGA